MKLYTPKCVTCGKYASHFNAWKRYCKENNIDWELIELKEFGLASPCWEMYGEMLSVAGERKDVNVPLILHDDGAVSELTVW